MKKAIAFCLGAGALSIASVAMAQPDVIVAELPSTSKYGPSGGSHGYSVGTTSCNVGSSVLEWFDDSNRHPVITQNVFKIDDGRIMHLAMANPKHGFCALSGTVCGSCAATNCDTLGVGCSDPYSSSLNGSQGGLGPKSDVNPITGFFNWPFTSRGNTGGSLYKRAPIPTSELDSGTVYVSSHYMTPDETGAARLNNESYRQVNVSGSYSLNTTGPTVREKYMIQAWKDTNSAVTEQIVDVPGDGRFIVAAHVTQNLDGTYRYNYAVQNYNSDRAMDGFTVPLPAGVTLGGINFHMPEYHSAEAWSNDPWNPTQTATFLRWQMTNGSANAGALRWDTMATFWFDADASPSTGTVTLSLFKSGSPASVTATMPVPTTVGNSGPLNDDFANAIALGDGSTFNFNTDNATTDGPDEATLCTGSGDTDVKKDLWYTFTPDCDGNFIVSLCGSSFDTKLALYNGVPGGANSAIACDDDGCTDGDGLQSTLIFDGTEATTYYIRVGGFTNGSGVTASGAGTITVTGPDCTGGVPQNGSDECADAPLLPEGSGTYNANTTGATDSPFDEPGTPCANAGTDNLDADVWWRWPACADGTVTVDTCGIVSWDTRLAIYDGCPTGNGQSIVCNDDFDCDGDGGVADDGYRARVSFTAVEGTTYYIRLGGWNGANGTGQIAITAPDCEPDPVPPLNDECPASIGVSDPGVPFSNINATTDGPAHAACDQFGDDQVQSDIWFNYPSIVTGTLTISTCPGTGSGTADFDTKIAVYDGSGCAGLPARLMACNDDFSGCSGSTSEITINIVAGQNYYIRVGGFEGAQGNGFLALITVPTGACCFSDGSCTIVSEADCTSQGGSYQGDGVDCLNANCPQPTGACCFPNGSCVEMTDADCGKMNGSFQGVGSDCGTANCPQPTGACCFSDGSCLELTFFDCGLLSGSYQGDGTDCLNAACPQPEGACCFSDGSCSSLTEEDCNAQGGSFQGDSTTCGTANCPQPTGACCFTDGSCLELTSADCGNQGGSYQGDGTDCLVNNCPQPTGACCFTDGSCLELTSADCGTQGGTYQGNGTDCLSAACPQPDGACCLPTAGVAADCFIATDAADCANQGGTFQGAGTTCSACPVACPCDWNLDGNLNDQDFFDWVNDFASQSGPQGGFDYNNDGNQNDQDWFDYTNCFFNPPAECQ